MDVAAEFSSIACIKHHCASYRQSSGEINDPVLYLTGATDQMKVFTAGSNSHTHTHKYKLVHTIIAT